MSDLEDLLRRYRPADPPPGLEARIFGEPRVWPWAAAAAALLALTLGLQVASRQQVVVFDQHMGGDVPPLPLDESAVPGALP
jgi:hypothetical protein